jgi:chorismate-pyruvate lyase
MILAALMLLQGDPVAALDAELRASNSATAVLQKRCAEPIRAQISRDSKTPVLGPEDRARLQLGPRERVAYRYVRLVCGGKLLSRATNWYVPSRLTPEMNAALESGDTPFGVVIRPLGPTRKTFAVETATDTPVLRQANTLLVHHAIVLDRAGRPLAEVEESYTTGMLPEPK